MSTPPQKDKVAQDKQQQQQQEQEQEQEKQTRDTETEAGNQEKANNVPTTTKENVVTAGKEKVKIPVKTAIKKPPSEASTSATKRKLDARNLAAEPLINKHQKTKKDLATKLMKIPAIKANNGGTNKTREFSFARPTESSARRTAALTETQTKKGKATQPPCKPLQQLKRTPAKAQCASTLVLKTLTVKGAADKASRPQFSYTPYTGPLPPLTVESSFAPKNGQISDRRAWSVSPAQMKAAPATRKPRLATAKKT